MVSAEELVRAAQAAPAPPAPPPPMPYPAYYAPAPKPRGNFLSYVLIALLIVGAFFIGSSGLVSITDLAKAPAMAMTTPAPGASILMPTARVVLSNGYGVVTPVPAQQQAPPLAQQAVPTAIPAQAQAPAQPTALPVSNVEIPVPATTNSDVQPTAEPVVPQYQYDPNGPDPMPAKTTGEYEGWNGGAGAGWVIPTPQAVAQPTAQPVAARNRDETVAAGADYSSWGGGGGQGWDIPAADNNGWSLGN